MSIYDILMLIVFGGAIFFGYWKGLAWQVASLSSIVVSYFVAYNFHGMLSPYISIGEPWNKFAAMLILFLGTSLLIWLAFGYVRNTINEMKLDGFDHQAGAIVGALKGAALCMVITLFSVTLLPNSIQAGIVASKSGYFIARSINQLSMMVPEEIHAVLEPRLNEFNERVADHGVDATKPLNSENRDGWFEGNPQLRTRSASSETNIFEGQFQTPSAQPNNQFPSAEDVGRELIRGTIDKAFESIGRGTNDSQNR